MEHVQKSKPERDEFPDIMDEPTEKPVKDGAWWRNLGIGIAATTVLAVAAIFLAPVIATVAVAALAVAAVGTAGVTAYVSWKDAKTGHGRGLGQFAFELLVGGVAGALLGAGTVVFWPVITATVTAASEQAAFLGTYYFGGSALFNSYVLPLIPTIGKVTGFTIFGLNGINIWNDIYGLCTGDNVLLDTVFNGNEEVYGAAQIVLEMTTERMHQMASDSMARKASGTYIESGRTSTTGENSRILSDNLAREGRAVGEGEAAAHIVASTGTKRQWASAADSRALLTRYDIDINDAANGIPLGHPRPHNLTHNRAFHEMVNASTPISK